jgi:hypothetical protein
MIFFSWKLSIVIDMEMGEHFEWNLFDVLNEIIDDKKIITLRKLLFNEKNQYIHFLNVCIEVLSDLKLVDGKQIPEYSLHKVPYLRFFLHS